MYVYIYIFRERERDREGERERENENENENENKNELINPDLLIINPGPPPPSIAGLHRNPPQMTLHLLPRPRNWSVPFARPQELLCTICLCPAPRIFLQRLPLPSQFGQTPLPANYGAKLILGGNWLDPPPEELRCETDFGDKIGLTPPPRIYGAKRLGGVYY